MIKRKVNQKDKDFQKWTRVSRDPLTNAIIGGQISIKIRHCCHAGKNVEQVRFLYTISGDKK